MPAGGGVIVGVNYPWRHYGGDFGATVWGRHTGVSPAPRDIADDCAAMAAHGVKVVRWFVFADGRGGLRVDAAGWPDGLHPATFDDLDAALGLAAAAGLQVVPVLFDHPWHSAPPTPPAPASAVTAQWLADREGQARLLERIVEPVVARYGPHGPRAELAPAIHAWELLNEPDWIVGELNPSRLVERPVPFDVLAAWVRDAADLVHRHAGLVTIGGARLRFAAWWDDPLPAARLPAGARLLRPGARLRPPRHAAAGAGRDPAARDRRVRGAGRSARHRPQPAGAEPADARRGGSQQRLQRPVAVELARRGRARSRSAGRARRDRRRRRAAF